MNTAELKHALDRCTDPKAYDQLKSQLEEQEKIESIQNAEKVRAAESANEKQHSAKKTEFESLIKEIKSKYQEVENLDKKIFDLVRELVPSVNDRLSKSADVELKEVHAMNLANELGLPFEKKPISLIGGQSIDKKPHRMIKIWLQRFEDWSHKLGGADKVTKSIIASHGLQGGTEAADLPNTY
jgi:hypothetical protein